MRRTVVVALGFAAAVAACGDGGRLTAGQAIRLVGDPGIKRDVPFLQWGSVVTIGDVPRPVLSASAPVAPPTELLPQPEGGRKIGARIPPDFSALPWLIFETTVTAGGATTMMRSWPVTTKVAGTTYTVWVTEAKVGPDGIPGIRLWPVPDLARRDVETGDIAVPAGTVLEVGLGIEPITWDTTVIPLDMTVTAIADGKETVLSKISVDSRRPEAKQWLDIVIPLESLGGKTVRFRFASRPQFGPTAVVSLPVWADPTIVAARETAPTP